MAEQPTREELDKAEAFLKMLNLPEDDWIIKHGQQYFSIGEVVDKLFGLEVNGIRKRAEDGAIPGAIQLDERHWRLPRSGLIYYIAEQRKRQAQTNAG